MTNSQQRLSYKLHALISIPSWPQSPAKVL
jgi:hypothetical protein